MAERLTKEMREYNHSSVELVQTHARTNGSHFVYINRMTHRHISVNKKLNRMVRDRLIKENCLEV